MRWTLRRCAWRCTPDGGSLSTVKTRLGSLMAKLGVRNRVELALWAYQTRRLD